MDTSSLSSCATVPADLAEWTKHEPCKMSFMHYGEVTISHCFTSSPKEGGQVQLSHYDDPTLGPSAELLWDRPPAPAQGRDVLLHLSVRWAASSLEVARMVLRAAFLVGLVQTPEKAATDRLKFMDVRDVLAGRTGGKSG